MRTLLAFFLLAALCRIGQAQLSARQGKDYALFFAGVKYDNSLWVELPDTKIETDAIAAELRNNYGFDIEIVSNPSKADIVKKMNEYAQKSYGNEDQLLVFFSMHGCYNAELDEGYLIPSDGAANVPYSDTWLTHNDLTRYLNLIKCRHILVNIDACHSGSFGLVRGRPDRAAWEQEPDCQTKIRQALQYKTRLYAASGNKDTRTPARSQFARLWLEALRSNDADGIISFAELMSVVTQAQPRPVYGEFRGQEVGGDFIIVKKNGCRQGGAISKSPDADYDGIPDAEDKCPDLFGTKANSGCPEKINGKGNTDADYDGISDERDACPTEFGTAKANGCPDRDDDGVPDKVDKCPDIDGKPNFQGCPAPGEDKPDPFGLILVQGGTVRMSEGGINAADSVVVNDFWIGKYEVTQAQWKSVMESNPSYFKNCDQCPVENVSWNDVQEFLKKLNNQYPGRNYRLPTEAEWQYAASGGSSSKGFKYAGGNDLNEVGWFKNNSLTHSHPVGQKKANELGLYDMSGNVFELTGDWIGGFEMNARSSSGDPISVMHFVCRGGSWFFGSEECFLSGRRITGPTSKFMDSGFRLARSK